ncbi:response regulator [Anabaena sp. CA = ATCC 33047]|uniref:response regulator n=1 Tax=Anabaena sp. (strain CA / ATCC 33047) TaxID=52271 RepID=UPI000835E955|nr:response regulator [Anabaena sp. CA = ATCC 33047]
MKILLVADDVLLSAALIELLQTNHYSIDLANDGEAGLDLAMAAEYDLILLDWLIPKLDVLSLCRQLRSRGDLKPILLITSQDANADIVAALDAGADDYIVKPYEAAALLAKIRSLLRRSGVMASSTLIWDNLCLEQASGKVIFNQQLISLTATEYKLLELFLQNPNRIFSRQIILDQLWGFDDAPMENAVTTHIKDLRKKLKAVGLTEDIIETVYGMGYRLKPPPEQAIASDTASLEANNQHKTKPTPDITNINRVLERFRHSFSQQVAILEAAKTALLAGNLHTELQQTAKQEAHKLAGSMGAFGYPEGSRIARVLEHLLNHNGIPPTGETRRWQDDQIAEFSQLVTALQQELTKSPVSATTQPSPAPEIHRILVIDDDVTLTEQLKAEAAAWGMGIKIAPDLATARSLLSFRTPDAVLLDLSFSGIEENGLTFLQELAQRSPNLPIVVFTARDSLADRLAVSRLGAKQFLHKGATTEQIFQTLSRVLPQPQTSEAKVLIVDDDPVILTGLSALLTPWGLEVTTLSEPQRFWEVLTATAPDLVLLDLEMPQVSGLELCQVVRQDAQWGDLFILVVTAHTDAESLQQAFAAGADDFITKPVLGPELVSRVISRIERKRSRR